MRRCQGKETQVSESKKKTKDFVKEETTLVREIGLGYSLLGPPRSCCLRWSDAAA